MARKTLLMPTSQQYGLLDDLSRRAVTLALQYQDDRISTTFWDYGERDGSHEFVREITAPGFHMKFFRCQGVIPETNTNDLAAVQSISFRNVTLDLARDYQDFCLCLGSNIFRPQGTDNQFTRYQVKLDKLPDFLTYLGWTASLEGKERVHFVVTEEVLQAIALQLETALNELENGEDRLTLSDPKITVHECPAALFPGHEADTNPPNPPVAPSASSASSTALAGSAQSIKSVELVLGGPKVKSLPIPASLSGEGSSQQSATPGTFELGKITTCGIEAALAAVGYEPSDVAREIDALLGEDKKAGAK